MIRPREVAADKAKAAERRRKEEEAERKAEEERVDEAIRQWADQHPDDVAAKRDELLEQASNDFERATVTARLRTWIREQLDTAA